MKKLCFAAPILFLLSCTESAQKDSHAGHDHSKDNVHTTATTDKVSYLTHDPMCKMERDESWQFHSIYNGDTVKFCAEYCKKGFDANPEKYAVK